MVHKAFFIIDFLETFFGGYLFFFSSMCNKGYGVLKNYKYYTGY